MSIRSVFFETFRILFSAPLLFLAIQLPQGIVDASEYFIEQQWGDKETLLMGAFALTAFIIGVFPSCLTFALVWEKTTSFSKGLDAFRGRWGLVLASSVLSGILFAVGVMAYVVPGILLMTLYLFVPYLILTEERAPLTSYFYRSSQIARKHFIKVLAAVFGALILFLTFQGLGQTFGAWISDQASGSPMETPLLVVSMIVFSMLVNAFVNIWVANFYLALVSWENRKDVA